MDDPESHWQYSSVVMPNTSPAVALLFFRRPDHLRQVVEQVARSRPATLLLVADGPRIGNAQDAQLCEQARAVVEKIDWPCDVRRNYADSNMGCRRRIASGLDWIFEQVEEAIILEDDCLPDPSFFPYCAELLEHYRENTRIMHIGGANLQLGAKRTHDSYYFSKYAHVWGWASWRRAWKRYDVNMSAWKTQRFANLPDPTYMDSLEEQLWAPQLDDTASGKIDTWDNQWQYTCWRNGGLAITPATNLIRNIGFDALATHTNATSRWANLPLEPLAFPLRHPQSIERNLAADQWEYEEHYGGHAHFEQNTLWGRTRRAMRTVGQKLGLISRPPGGFRTPPIAKP